MSPIPEQDVVEAGLGRYLRFWETVTPARIGELDVLVTADFVFRDPFNETRGAEAAHRVLRHMFEICREPVFTMLEYGLDLGGPDEQGRWAGYACWRFAFRPASAPNKHMSITGMTRLVLTADGRVSRHEDHWDTAHEFLLHLPVIGWLVRRVLRAMAAERGFRRV